MGAQTFREGKFDDESGAVHTLRGQTGATRLLNIGVFDYFQMFSYLNRGRINIHDRKHIHFAEKNPKYKYAQPGMKVPSEEGYSCHILFVYLFIYFYFYHDYLVLQKETEISDNHVSG